MLVMMTYNSWMIGAIVAGAILGAFLYSRAPIGAAVAWDDKSTACHENGGSYLRKTTPASAKIWALRSSILYSSWYTTSITPVWTIFTAQRRHGHLC